MMSAPSSLPGDKWLAALCSLAHIAEEVSIVFDMDDPSAIISFTETKTQYHLKAFERQLSAWKASLPSSIDKRLVEHHYGSINLYIHEIAIHHEHNINVNEALADGTCKQAHEATAGSIVTTVYIDALTACLDSSHRVLDSYLKLDLLTCRSVINLYTVWNTYAIVALIKLHGVLNASDSAFGSIFTPDLRVEYYLDAITAKLSEVSSSGRYLPAEAFIFVTKKLRSWHTHKRAPQYEPVDTSTSGTDPVRSDQDLAERGVNSLMSQLAGNKPKLYDPPPQQWGPGGGLSKKVLHMPDESELQSQSQAQTQTQTQSQQQGDPANITTNNINASSIPGIGGVGSMGAESGMFGASQTSDFNAAFNAASYNLDWNDLNFSQDEMDLFDSYMNDQGWMGYLI